MRQTIKQEKQRQVSKLGGARQLRATGRDPLADAVAASPQMATQRTLMALIEQSPRMAVQRKLGAAQQPSTTSSSSNRTGLPDRLKAGVEKLSGIALDDVKVHYNSHKPAQLQALAYAQGSSIYLGPGQARHLPHEAWHVVQQRQGRVRPTVQMKGVAINDARHLEAEADAMGARAMSIGGRATSGTTNHATFRSVSPSSHLPVMQGVLVIGKDSFYSLDDLKKKKAYFNQLNGEKTSPEARKKIIAWIEDQQNSYPTEAVNTMTDAINKAQAAADQEKPSSISSLSISHAKSSPVIASTSIGSFVDEGKEKEKEKYKEEKKTDSAPEHPGAVNAEALEDEITRVDEGNLKNYINNNFRGLREKLQVLIGQAETGKHPDEILQIHRFIGTTEFRALENNKNTKKWCSKLEETVIQKAEESRLFEVDSLLVLIPPEWEVTDLVAQAWNKKQILDAPHGVDTSTAKPIDEVRLAQTMGELQRSKAALQEVFKLGFRTHLFRSPHDFSTLVLRVLQGSVRRFKIDSVLALLQKYEEYLPILNIFIEKNRMSEAAISGLRQALLGAVQGEGHRSREQQKMLLVLINHLKSHSNERCLAYEPDDGQANYDLLTHDVEDNSKKLIEVETIPDRERRGAHEFYKEKYQKKLGSIKRTEESVDAQLYLFIPVKTKLPKDQIELIKRDKELPILNIDEIEPSDLLD